MIRVEELEAPAPSTWKRWWDELQKDRGGRAELRRCGRVSEAVFCAPYHLLRRMRGNPENDFELRKLALISIVLAHVDDDARGTSFPRLLAEPKGEKAVVSDARFRQLLRSEDFDERLGELVRVVHQLGRRAPVDALANDLWWWNERTRRQWALGYYENAPRSSRSSS